MSVFKLYSGIQTFEFFADLICIPFALNWHCALLPHWLNLSRDSSHSSSAQLSHACNARAHKAFLQPSTTSTPHVAKTQKLNARVALQSLAQCTAACISWFVIVLQTFRTKNGKKYKTRTKRKHSVQLAFCKQNKNSQRTLSSLCGIFHPPFAVPPVQRNLHRTLFRLAP